MVRIRWEQLVALPMLMAGAVTGVAAWLSYGARVASVTATGAEGAVAQTLSSELAGERLAHLFGGALVVAAVVLWLVGGIRQRLERARELPVAA